MDKYEHITIIRSPKYIIHNKELNEALFSQPYIKAKTVGTLLGKTSRDKAQYGRTLRNKVDCLQTQQINYA